MANVFNSDVHKQFYIDGVQEENRDAVPFRYVAEINTENAEYLYNRYGSDITAQNSTDSTYTTPDFTYSADSKLIDKEAIAADRITYKELARQGFDIVTDRKDKHAYAIAKAVHRHAAYETHKLAGDTIDALDITGSGSVGDRLTLSASNPDDVAATAVQFLQESNCFTERNPYAMMTPKNAKYFNLFSMGAGFGFADKALVNNIFQVGSARVIRGAMGFGGLDLVITNEMPRFVVLTFSGALTAADTVTVNSVVFTAANAPSAAGEVDVEGGAEAQIDTLVAAINNSQGYAAGAGDANDYFEVSAANRTILTNAGVIARKLTATTMEVVSFSGLTVAKSASAVTLGTETSPILLGAYNSTTIALPSNGANVVEKEPPLFSGIELMFSQQHDATVWTKNQDKVKEILIAE